MARTLIAKHDEVNLKPFLTALEIEGPDCEVCTTDSAVRMCLVDNPPHLVIIDAGFPGLDAFEMVQVAPGCSVRQYTPSRGPFRRIQW